LLVFLSNRDLSALSSFHLIESNWFVSRFSKDGL
jgi:hypothetical protein